MGGAQGELKGPDLAEGVALSELSDGGLLLGHAGGEPVVLARSGNEVFAVGATCTHYSGPLAEGLMVGDTLRCPWHHACFSLRTGEALKAPALNPIPCYLVARDGDRVRVVAKIAPTPRPAREGGPARIVIVGAGAAGHAAAEMLRREGYAGELTLIGAADEPPVDRPNLSKDYLAGTAPEEWIPLRPPEFFAENRIELVLGTRVRSIDVGGRALALEDGRTLGWDAMLLAPGATPIRLPLPGGDLPHVMTLRSLADSRSIIGRAKEGGRAVILGASFIGLEVAASLRARGVEVHVVAPEARPLERVLGAEVGDFVRRVHEEKGVVFHLEKTASRIDEKQVTLSDDSTLEADLVVMGVGVRPELALAEAAGLTVDKGILVDEFLMTSAPGVYAAGDAARFPDPRPTAGPGDRLRIEHWVVAQRQGQTAAKNMLGARVPYRDVPFFWSAHYDATLAYVGHADPAQCTISVEGDLDARDAKVTYRRGDETLAVATLFRDRDSLEAEAAMERRLR